MKLSLALAAGSALLGSALAADLPSIEKKVRFKASSSEITETDRFGLDRDRNFSTRTMARNCKHPGDSELQDVQKADFSSSFIRGVAYQRM